MCMFFALLLTFLPIPLYAAGWDCKSAVEFYNKGTLSNNDQEKERCFRKAISLCSDPEILSRVLNNLGDFYEKKKEYSKALNFYRKAIEKKPDLSTSYFGVGDIFFTLGDYYSAFIMYKKGLRYNPDDEEYLKKLKEVEIEFKKNIIIYFDFNSYKLSDHYIYRLQLIGESIKGNSGKTKVMVIGHTCNLGPKWYNLFLSQKRAEAVAQFLREKFSIEGNTIITIGKGEGEPLLSNEDKWARTLNRRVEVIIK